MTSPRPLRFVASIALSALLAGLVTGTVLGHAELDTVTPADKSTVEGSPPEIVMTFTEPVKPANSSIKLVDSGGKVVVEGSTVDTGDARTMRLALPATLPPGAYTIRWTTASALDGDPDRGTTTFTLAAAPSAAPSTETTSPSAAASVAPSAAASVAPSPSPSAPPTAPATSMSDAVIPVVAALIVLAALGLWLLRGRSRGSR